MSAARAGKGGRRGEPEHRQAAGKPAAQRQRGSGAKSGQQGGAGQAAESPLHPNPQFARPGWISLDGQWQFAFDDTGAGGDPAGVGWTHKINVPFAPETPASGIERTDWFAGCWYRRQFDAPPLDGGRLLLRFGAVDYIASVYVNGRLAITHEGGYTPFHCDITALLRDSGPQEIVVHAMDDPHDLHKPRGKQDWQKDPHSIWYPRTTGIWQSVWLERVGCAWLDDVQWTPDLDRFEIELAANTAGETGEYRLHVRLHTEQRVLADDVFAVVGGSLRRSIGLADPGIDDCRRELLWRCDRPVLITAELELSDTRGVVVDRINSYTAMRSVGVQGDALWINGRPVRLRMALDQGYWPQSGLTPPSDEAARRDVELAKAMGFNAVRAHQRIADPRYLYWADVLGLLVSEEMPSAYSFSTRMLERLSSQWAEAIRRDRSHPCVIMWVPINESWGVPDLPSSDAQRDAMAAMYHLTKALDPTRPVVGNDGWEMQQTDIIAVHDYARSGDVLRSRYANQSDPLSVLMGNQPADRLLLLDAAWYRGQPVMLTEFGGIALRAKGTWGYTQADTPDAMARQYEALLAAVHDLPLLKGFCYTQFADTYQEANGLLYADRTPKFPMERIRAATEGRPAF